MAKRIQMRRDRPWRADHPNAVIVARPTKWGNPFTIQAAKDAGYRNPRHMAVLGFRDWLHGDPWACGSASTYEPWRRKIWQDLAELQGKDLACWCPLDQPCHADVLMELANDPGTKSGTAPAESE